MISSFQGRLYKPGEISHYIDLIYNIKSVWKKKTYSGIKPVGKCNAFKDHWSKSIELRILPGLHYGSTRD